MGERRGAAYPAHEIRGGLWDGAPVLWRGCPGVYHTWGGGRVLFEDRGALALTNDTQLPLEGLALRLDDPLGLGLAGLAARVAHSTGLPTERADTDDINCHLVGVYRRIGAPYGVGPGGRLCWAATYFALTDRLCAVLGLESRPSEAAYWVQLLDGGWKLTAATGVAWFNHEPTGPQYPLPKRIDDPLDSLRAAIRQVVQR